MKYNFKIAILILLISMTGCKESIPLKLSDLQFDNFENDKIASNKIDTTFMISKDLILSQCLTDTIIGYEVYDSVGNLLFEQGRPGWGARVTNRYDSIGLITYQLNQSCTDEKFHFTYQFIPESFLLTRLQTDSNYGRINVDTCQFKFDNNGRILESVENSSRAHCQIKFEYNNSGQLKKRTTYRKYLTTIVNFYYSNDKIDSTITGDYYIEESDKPYMSKTIYDMNGLKSITIAQRYNPSPNGKVRTFECMDGSKIISGMRDTVLTTYIHKKRIK